MKGFVGILFLIFVFALLSAGIYFLLFGYQRFESSKYAIDSLTEIQSDFTFFDTYTPQDPTSIRPGIILDSDEKVVYKSAFPPCLTLTEDRTWDIYASQNNILPSYVSKMYYDRFWRIGWLGLIPKNTNGSTTYTFYGPFRYTDIPSRNYLEYLLIGRDITQSGTILKFESNNDCVQAPLKSTQDI